MRGRGPIAALAAAGAAAAFWAANGIASALDLGASAPAGALSAAAGSLAARAASLDLAPDLSPGPLAAGVAAACCVLAAWATAEARRGNYRPGEEHGSARWATEREIRAFADARRPDMNIILTRRCSLAMERADHDPRLERNRNVLVVGGTGSGKSRGFIIPNIAQMHGSYIVTDPKGTVAGRVRGVLERGGYDVRVVDTIDPARSDRYNPIAYLRGEADIIRFADCLVLNTTGEGERPSDPFWAAAEKLLYTALVAYLVYHCPERDRTIPGMLTLLSLAEARDEDESFLSPLDLLFRELETGMRCVASPAREPPSPRGFAPGAGVRWVRVAEPADPSRDFALGRYKAFRAAAGKTLKSIIVSCNARLAPLAAAEVRGLLSGDDLALDRMGDEGARRALFCVMSDTNRTYAFLHAVLIWQALDLLCDRALSEHGGKLPVPVDLLLDEFANIGRLPDVEKSMAVVRSRNISISPVLQSMAQLKAAYGDSAQTIVDCCDTTLFLGGKSTETNREVSESVGKETVSTLTRNETRGASRTSTRNYQSAERDLIQPAEVARLDRRKAIVLIAGARPFLDDKYDMDDHPRLGRGGRGRRD